VRFYSFLFQGVPLMGGNPVLRVLLKQIQPHLIAELEKASPQALENMYQAMLCGLGQVYAPHAAAIVVDLRRSHVLIEEVEAAVGPRVLVEDDDLPALSDGDDSSVDVPTETEFPFIDEPLQPPPPVLPDAPMDDDDPLVGVEIDGVVYAIKQSQLQALKQS
jgi:hypothetical protein